MFGTVTFRKATLPGTIGTLLFMVSCFANAYPSDTFLNYLNQTRTDQKRNHQLCYAYEDSTPGLPCNPAFLGLDRQNTGWVYGYGNNNLQFFQDVADIVRGPIRAQELLAIVDHNSHDNFQLELSMGYVSSTWGVNVIPDKLVLFTNFRNPALPRITVLAAREREIQFQLGSFLSKEWSWGLQLRGVQRRFTYSDAYFSDYMTGDADFLNSIRSQNAYYIEPSLLYVPESSDWNPLASVMITNLGKPDFYMDPYDYNPAAQFAFSIAPQTDYGTFKMGVTSQWVQQAEINRIFSAAGLTYSYSWFDLFTTVSEFEKQLGVSFNFEYLTTSVSYAQQDWSNTPSPNAHSLWRWDLGILF
ncbi:MAG: hypothetical protein RJB66_990 [Pseudomonadota bacterium]|jgi:hypothetical protein